MNKAALQKACKKTVATASKHAPALLIGVGVVSIVSTAILAVVATPKAIEVLEDGKDAIDQATEDLESDPERLKKELWEIRKEMCKRFAKIYWKTAANAAIGATAVIFAYRTQKKRTLAVGAAYALAVRELNDWKETARELKILNKNNEQKIRDSLVKRKVERAEQNIKSNKQQVIFTGGGEDLFIDDWSGQVFKSSVTDVEKAVNEWNNKMLLEDEVTLNDLYFSLGIPEVPAGDLGFESSHGIVKVMFGSSFVNGKAYITMGFDRQPIPL